MGQLLLRWLVQGMLRVVVGRCSERRLRQSSSVLEEVLAVAGSCLE